MYLLMSFLFSTNTLGQVGVAPGVPPTGGMNIDGYLRRQPTLPGGDWFKGITPALQTPGTYLFNDNCTPALGGLIFHLTDPYNSQQDDIFSGSGPNQLDRNPNTWN